MPAYNAEGGPGEDRVADYTVPAGPAQEPGAGSARGVRRAEIP